MQSDEQGIAGPAGGSQSVNGSRKVQHPLAGSQQLLRRVTSVEDLLARDEADEEEEEMDDGFTSDVSSRTLPASCSTLIFDSQEEPFRCRPPSIASSVTSQRSSVRR